MKAYETPSVKSTVSSPIALCDKTLQDINIERLQITRMVLLMACWHKDTASQELEVSRKQERSIER